MNPPARETDATEPIRLQVLSELRETIFAVSDHVPPSQPIGMDTLLVADLALESIELASIFYRLNARYADTASLGDFALELAGTERADDLTAGRIVDFIAGALGETQPARS